MAEGSRSRVGLLEACAASFCIGLGFFVALSSYHSDLNADTLIVYFNSLIRWRPYFWGQDRYGMLIPALATGFQSPLANAIVQNALHVACSIAAWFAMARLCFGRTRWFEIGLLAVAVQFASSGLGDLMNFLTPWQLYAPALPLALGALVLSSSRSWIALCLLCVAEWCNFAIAAFVGPLVVAIALERASRALHPRAEVKALGRRLALLACAVAFGWFLKKAVADEESTRFRFVLGWDGLIGWTKMLADFATSPRSSLWMVASPPLAFAIAFTAHLRLRRSPRSRANALRVACACCASALFYGFVVGASRMAELSGYPRRYLIPSFMLWAVAWLGAGASLLPGKWIRSFRLRVGLILIIACLSGARLGWPIPGAAERSIHRRFAADFEWVALAGCTHVVGDYYRVWDNVFYSRVVGRPVWGIAHRAGVIKDLWTLEKFSDPTVCAWRDDTEEAARQLLWFRLTDLEPVGREGPLILLKRTSNPE